MASLHKRPRSPYWHAAWRDRDGRLVMRSTKQSDRSKAMAIALDFERAEKAAAAGNLVAAQARKVVSDIVLRNTGDTMENPTIEGFMRLWLANTETMGNAAATMTRYRGVADDFLATIGPKAKRFLTALSPADVELFMRKRDRDGCSPTTIRLDVKILRGILNNARRKGLIPTNPAEAVDLPKGKAVERGTFTAAEVQMLINTGEGEWPDLIRLAYFTGQRLGDLCALKWDAVNLAAGTITFATQKTGEEIVVPIHPELLARLEALAGIDKPQEHVLPHMAGLGVGGRHGLSEGFKRIVVKSGLDLGTVQGGGDRKVSKRSFHALRHSFVSALANAGVSPELRMKLTGHASEKIHSGYTHQELSTLQAAMAKHPGINYAKPEPKAGK